MRSATSTPIRRALLGLTATTVAVGSSLVLSAGPVSAAPPGNEPLAVQSGELVVNGSGDSTGGWAPALISRPHGANSYPASVIVDSTGLTGATFAGGARFLGGNAVDNQTSTQTVSLNASAAAIDSGLVTADISSYLGGYLNQEDRATIKFDFRDASDASLTSRTYGPVTAADRGNASGFIRFGEEVAVPTGARSVLITLTFVRYVAPVNDGYVDEVSVKLSAPVPTATPDTPTTVQDQLVTFNPVTNDSAVGGTTLDATSVRLLDGSTPVTTLTTADGTYTVDTSTGEITFTPTPGFTGTAGAVSYQVADSNGQLDTATITVTVGPVVGVPIVSAPAALGTGLFLAMAGGAFVLRRRMLATR